MSAKKYALYIIYSKEKSMTAQDLTQTTGDEESQNP